MKQQKSLAQDDKKKRRRKLLALILIPFGITGVVLGTVLPLTMCQNVVHVPPLKIDSSIDSKYLIANGQNVYFSSTVTTYHNTLLDLKAYADDCDYTGNDFIIDGTVDFGIMVGFDQDINLSGKPNSLIYLTSQTTNTYGIVVGSVTAPAENIPYTGEMTINPNVNVNISSSENSFGVYFAVPTAAEINVEGVFKIVLTSSGKKCYGVYFISTYMDSSQTINGVFNIQNSGATTGSDACGVFFNGTSNGSLQVNGVFYISTVASYGSTYGIFINSNVFGDIQVDGAFSIKANGPIFGIVLNATLAGSFQCNGTFALVTTSSSVTGVYIKKASDASALCKITGTFVFIGDAAFNGNQRGIDLPTTGQLPTLQGVPKFFSTVLDKGQWISNAMSEYWNDVLCDSAQSTTGDSSLTITSIYDTGSAADCNLQIFVILNATDDSADTYNSVYKAALQAYSASISGYDSIAMDWLTNIIDQI